MDDKPTLSKLFVKGVCGAGRGEMLLVPEVPHSGEDHRKAKLVSRRDHLFIAHGTAGLYQSRCAGFRRSDQAVREGEECV